MTHINEAMCIYIEDNHKIECPFCPVDQTLDKETITSYIGVHNSGAKLGKNITITSSGPNGQNITGTPSEPAGFSWPDEVKTGTVTVEKKHMRAEAHHLVPGMQALYKVHDLEQWLVKDPRTVKRKDSKTGKSKDWTSPSEGSCRPDGDVGFDINSTENGIWLPSAPKARTFLGNPVKYIKPNGWSAEKIECKEVAFNLMEETKLQFHKGGHSGHGNNAPTQCYVGKAIRLLSQIYTFIEAWSKSCAAAKQKKITDGKHPPPYEVNKLIHKCASDILRNDVTRHPATWTVFVSQVAYEYHADVKKRTIIIPQQDIETRRYEQEVKDGKRLIESKLKDSTDEFKIAWKALPKP